VVIVLTMAAMLASVATGVEARTKSTSSCSVSPSPVVSGGSVTVSGKAGRSGNWINAYLYYSDGGWQMLGGSVGSGGSFSLSDTAQESYTSYWGPFYPAVSGAGHVEIYTGSASRSSGMVASCSFNVS
jgi:hypothetical protein